MSAAHGWNGSETENATYSSDTMAKRISPPVLTALRESEANFAAFADDDIVGLRFGRQVIAAVQREHFHLNNCAFSNALFRECRFSRSHFNDVLFENCDLSNIDFSGCSFFRAAFMDCKMMGTDFSGASMQHVTM